MADTYDINTDAGKVRLLISDTGGDDDASFIFHDNEVDAFLAMESNLYRAASLALRTLAGNEVLVQKRIKFLDLSTDGPAEAKALHELAKTLDDRATALDDEDCGPDIINMGDSPFTERDIALGRASID